MNPSGERGTSDIRGFVQQSHAARPIPRHIVEGDRATRQITFPLVG